MSARDALDNAHRGGPEGRNRSTTTPETACPNHRQASTLAEQLRDRAIATLILAGVSTRGVVLSTVRDAADRDYEVFVLADATADPEPGVHGLLVERIFPRQAHVITVAQLDSLLSGTDERSI
jgi:nicotinamidase-related amidase